MLGEIDPRAGKPPAARFHFQIVDDFPILWDLFQEDDVWESVGRERLFSKRSDGNYAVTDDCVWGFLIEQINRRGKGRGALAKVDYSGFLVRGHYTRSEALGRIGGLTERWRYGPLE